MSTTIDTKVVEMKFDNDQFEKGVAESMSTLDKLKEKLKDAGDGESLKELSKAANEIDMSSLANNVESIKERFSLMGIIGMTAIQNIANEVVNLGKKIVSAVPSQIANGGWNRAMNLENAKFQLEGLGYTWDKVGAQINNAVSGTAYSLDSAAKAAGSLVASGVAIEGEGDALQKSLTAISAVAAQTNSDYDGIASIFTTVAGNGKLMSMQLQQLSNRGLNAAATIAKVLGTTEANVRSMVSNGEIDFQTFSDAMLEAFGEHAYQANETFQGSLANMKAALSKIGANFTEPIIQNAIPVFNSLRTKINQCKDEVENFAKYDLTSSATYEKDIGVLKGRWEQLTEAVKNGTATQEEADAAYAEMDAKMQEYVDHMSPWEKAIRLLRTEIVKIIDGIDVSWLTNVGNVFYNIGKGILSFISPIKQAFSAVFNSSNNSLLYSITEKLSELSTHLVLNDNASKQLYLTFRGLFSIFDLVGTVIHELLGMIPSLDSQTFSLAEQIFKVTGFLGNVIYAITTLIKQTGVIKGALTGIGAAIGAVLGTIALAISKIVEAIKIIKTSGITALINKIANKLKPLKDKLDGIVDAFEELFVHGKKVQSESTILNKVINKVDEIVKSLNETFKNLIDRVKEFLAQHPILQTAFNGIAIVVKVVAGAILGLGAGIVSIVGYFVNCVKNGINPFVDGIEKIKALIPKVTSKLGEFGKSIKEIFSQSAIAEKFGSVIDFLSTKITHFKSCLAGLFGKKSDDGITIESGKVEAVEYLSSNAPGVMHQLDLTGNTVETFGDKLKNFFKTLDAGKLVAIGFSVAMVALSIKIIKVVDNLGSLMGAATGLMKKLGSGGVIGIIFGNNDSKKSENKIKEIATSIVALAGALFLISTIDSDSLKKSAIVMAELAGIIEILTISLTVCGQVAKSSGGLDKLVDAIGKMAIGIAGMAVVVRLLDGLDFVSAQKSVLVIVELAAVMVAMGVAMSRYAKKIEIGSISMIGFTVAMLLLTKSLKNLEGLNVSVESIGYFTLLIAGIALAGKVAGNLSVGMFAGLLAAAVALKVALPILQSAFTSIKMDKIKKQLFEFQDMLATFGIEAGLVVAGVVALALVGAALSKATLALSVALIAFTGSIAIISLIVKAFKDIKLENIYTGLIVCGVFGALLTVFTAIAKKCEANVASLIAFSATLVVITSCVALLSGLAVVIGMVPYDQLLKGGLLISALLGMISLMMVASKSVNGLKTGPIVAMITGIILVITEMIVVSLLMEDHYQDLMWSTLCVGTLMVLFGDMMKKVSRTMTSVTKLGAMITAAGVLAEIGVALYSLSHLGWKSLAASTAAMSACLIVYTECLKKIGKAGDNFGKSKLKAMLEMAGVLTVIGTALYALSLNPWNQVLVSMAAMSACLLAYAEAMTMLGKKGMSFDYNKLMAMALMAPTLGIIGTSLYFVAKQPWESIATATTAMITALMSVVAALSILSGMDSNGMVVSAGAIIAVSGAMVILAAALVILNEVDSEATTLMATSLIALTVCLGVLSVLGNENAEGMILAAAAIVVVSGAMLILAAALAVIGEAGNTALNTFTISLMTLCSVMVIFSVAASTFAPGVAMAVVAMLSLAATALSIGVSIGIAAAGISLLVTAITGLVNAVTQFIPVLVSGFKSLVDTFTALSKVDFSGFSENMGTMALAGIKMIVGAVGVTAMASALNKYSTAVTKVASVMSSKLVKQISTVPTQMAQIGGFSLQGFSNGITNGSAWKAIISGVAGFANSSVETMKKVLGVASPSKILRQVGDWCLQGFNLGLNNGTFWGNIINDVGKRLGTILNKFANTVEGIEKTVAGLGDGDYSGLGKIGDKIKESLDIKSIVEESTAGMEDYSESLGDVSAASGSAASSTQDLSSAFSYFSRKVSTTSGQILNNMASNIRGTVEWTQAINNLYGKGLSSDLMNYLKGLGTSGYETIKVFESMTLEEIQRANALFADNMALNQGQTAKVVASYTAAGQQAGGAFVDTIYQCFDEDLRSTIESAIDPFEEFSKEVDVTANDVLNSMQSQIDGITEWTNKLNDLVGRGISQELLKYLEDLGPQGYKYVNAFSTMTTEQLAQANSQFATVMTLDEASAAALQVSYDTAGQMVSAGFTQGIDNSAARSAMTAFATSGINAFNTAYGIHSPSKVMITKGLNTVQGFRNGISTNWHLVNTVVNTVAKSSLVEFDKIIGQARMMNVGKNVCEGLARGIRNNSNIVKDAAEQVAIQAYNAARRALEIHSPSRKFAEIGKYSALGMAQGLDNYSDKPVSSIETLSNVLLQNAQNAMAQVEDILNSDSAMQPIIRPVLDLSGIQNGSQMLSDMFYSSPSVATHMAGSISTRMGEIATGSGEVSNNQNTSNIQNITFNQTNNSPKALSRYEIYRQTRNQLAMMKGVMQ